MSYHVFMAFFGKPTLLFYLLRTGFIVYGSNLSEPVTFPYDQEVVKNLEVANKTELRTQLLEFFKQFNLKEADIAIVLSEQVIFHKVFPELEKDRLEKELTIFVNEVPFEQKNVISDSWSKDQITHIYALNKEIYEIFQPTIAELKWQIVSVLPLFMFFAADTDPQSFNNKNELTPEEVQYIVKNRDVVKTENLLILEPLVLRAPTLDDRLTTPQQKKYVTFGLILFILIVWLVIIFFLVRSFRH